MFDGLKYSKISKNDIMAEKLLYSADEVQTILKKAIEATSKGIFEKRLRL